MKGGSGNLRVSQFCYDRHKTDSKLMAFGATDLEI